MRVLSVKVCVLSVTACGEKAGPWPSALKARGLDSRVLLELLIIPLLDPPNSNSSLFIQQKSGKMFGLGGKM